DLFDFDESRRTEDTSGSTAKPSATSSFFFVSRPPIAEYSPRPPAFGTTRWHGITMTAGLRAHAVPTARDAFGRPSRRATSPQVIVVPGGIVRRNSKTSRSKGPTSRWSG